jgi:multisubunit Na+/H+ antiporter MnhB subunit
MNEGPRLRVAQKLDYGSDQPPRWGAIDWIIAALAGALVLLLAYAFVRLVLLGEESPLYRP